MTKNIFQEPRKGVVAHTAASRLLAEDQQLQDWVYVSTNELWQGAAQTVNAIVRYPGSQEPNQTGFTLANNTEKSIFEYFEQHPECAQRFGNAMSSYTADTGYELEHLIHGFDWSSLGHGTVVDVSGFLNSQEKQPCIDTSGRGFQWIRQLTARVDVSRFAFHGTGSRSSHCKQRPSDVSRPQKPRNIFAS